MAEDAVSLRKYLRVQLFAPDAPAFQVAYGLREIKHLIPHRDPFLLLDEITAVDPAAGLIAGRRTVPAVDPVFAGHFPGRPLYPGVLLVETLGQLGCCLLCFMDRGNHVVDFSVKPPFVLATKIKAALFAAPVLPGAQLTLLGRCDGWDGLVGGMTGQVLHEGKICCALSGELCVVE